MRNISLYLHIPFCKRKCYYCNFVSFCLSSKQIDDYVNLLCEEIEMSLNKEMNVVTIYLGGGTPSLLGENNVRKIFETIKSCANIDSNAEITIEVNPNSVTKEKLQTYLEIGINRISVGIQSFKQKSLNAIGRLHTAKDAKNCLKLIKKIGFENISADLILGIPFSTKHSLKKSLSFLTKNCTHISAYSLILEEGTRLFEFIENGQLKLPSEEKTLKQYDFIVKYLRNKKFFQYEVSNFCKLGNESKHNMAYWKLKEYLGLGVSAHSYYLNQRFSNPETIDEYAKMIKNKDFSLRKREIIELNQLREEFIMLGLRLTNGINLKEYSKLFGQNLEQAKKNEIKFLSESGLIEIKDNYLFATMKGFNVLNQIILKLI